MKFDLEDWCENHLDGFKPSSRGEITALCPRCEKPEKFYVNVDPDDEHWGRWICFSCDEFRGGTPIPLISEVEGLSWTEARNVVFRGSVNVRRKATPESLTARISGIRESGDGPLGSDAWVEPAAEIVSQALPPEYIPCYDPKRKRPWMVPKYLKQRGYKKETIKRFGFGFCQAGRYGGRVIIPIKCPNGNSFTARDLRGDQEPKYLNPKEVDHSRLLYGWEQAKPGADTCIVEGGFDVAMMHQHGFQAYGIGGKHLSEEQLKLLRTLPRSTRFTVMLDPEEVEKAFETATMLLTVFKHVRIAELPPGTDPGSSSKKVKQRAYRDAESFSGGRGSRTRRLVSKTANALADIYG